MLTLFAVADVAVFLSTPSARRATFFWHINDVAQIISIHALREEGDVLIEAVGDRVHISIHALREEGDTRSPLLKVSLVLFLSTPSARRATPGIPLDLALTGYFYPRPPRGGRPAAKAAQNQRG